MQSKAIDKLVDNMLAKTPIVYKLLRFLTKY